MADATPKTAAEIWRLVSIAADRLDPRLRDELLSRRYVYIWLQDVRIPIECDNWYDYCSPDFMAVLHYYPEFLAAGGDFMPQEYLLRASRAVAKECKAHQREPRYTDHDHAWRRLLEHYGVQRICEWLEESSRLWRSTERFIDGAGI